MQKNDKFVKSSKFPGISAGNFRDHRFPAAASTVVQHWRGRSRWPDRKSVTDAHRALIPTCIYGRHSLKVHSGWHHRSCKISTMSDSLSLWLFRCLSCTINEWLHRTHQFCRQFNNNFVKLRGDIRHFVPGWPNIAGDASPASPAALRPMPLTYSTSPIWGGDCVPSPEKKEFSFVFRH